MAHTVAKSTPSGIKEFTVYTEDEARAQGIVSVPWALALPGQWGRTDDGYVAECIDKKRYKGRDYLKFSFASVWVNKHPRFSFTPFLNTGNFGGTSPRGWLELEMGRSRFKRMVHALAKMTLAGTINYMTLGNIYRRDQKLPDVTVRRLLRRKEVKECVAKEIDILMDEMGMDHKYVLQQLREAAEMAKKGFPNKNGDIIPDLSNFLRAIEDMVELRNMKPKGKKVVDMIEFDVSGEIEEGIRKEEGRLSLSRTQELPPGELEVEDAGV